MSFNASDLSIIGDLDPTLTRCLMLTLQINPSMPQLVSKNADEIFTYEFLSEYQTKSQKGFLICFLVNIV